MRVFLIEPYYAGSHRSWADGWQQHSRHEIHLLTMEGRFWKWRMHGGPVTMAAEATELARSVGAPDVIVASSMLDLATFKGLCSAQLGDPPALLYMHENQLIYPPSPRTRGEDLSYAFVNWRSMVAADHILFNSHYHQDVLFDALPGFLKNFPDYRHVELIDGVRSKSDVTGVGIDVRAPAKSHDDPPLILWNQRWEYDKNPIEMFEILYEVADHGIDFRLAVCGENFRQTPTEFEDAQLRLADKLVHFGFAERAEYDALIGQADIAISTAHHEFFGVSIAEAVAAGAFPVLPRRLSYPELVPAEVHAYCLFNTPQEAVSLVMHALTTDRNVVTKTTAPAFGQFAWAHIAPMYDDALDTLI